VTQVIVVAFVFLLLAAIGGSRKSSAFLRADVKPLVGLLNLRNPTSTQLRAGAVYALGIGYTQAARVLRERADFVDNVRKVAALLSADATDKSAISFKSPWDDVADNLWMAYVKASRFTAEDRDGRDWLVGIFGLSPRALERLGIMAEVKRDGERWSGRWAGILPIENFLKSLPAQVQALSAISRLHRAESRDTIDGVIGQEIEGRSATLSGLLAVALRAGGAKGLDSWLNSEGDRRKFKRTTAAYLKLNGIF
jgi:hypothetical protein